MPSRVLGRNGGDLSAVESIPARRAYTFLLALLVLLPAVVACGLLYRQSLPVPYQDDYDAILAFAIAYQQTPALPQKILVIAAQQHNEYKLAFAHAVIAAELEATQQVNFVFLTALGNLFLLPIAYLLWLTYRHDEPGRLLAFLPISFLFFALTYWENLNWATTGLQNTPVILFSLLAIYLVAPRQQAQPSGRNLLFGCLAAALAALTSANGFLLAPVGLWIFLNRRNYISATAWCAAFVLPLAAYLYRFSPVAHPAHHAAFYDRPLFLFAFLGSVLGFRWPAALLGFFIALTVVLSVRARFDRANPAAFYFTVWVLATACLVAWVRGALGFLIASRYSIYSILMLIFCYGFLMQYLPTRWVSLNRRALYVTAAVFAAGFCCVADVHAWHKLAQRRQMVLAGVDFYRRQPAINSPMIDARLESGAPQEKGYEQRILTQSIEQGIYTLPPQP